MAKNIVSAVLTQKCPRCRQGNLFEQSNPYRLSDLFKMPKACSHCGLLFELEPSFFYGAMYVNYALTIAISVGIFLGMFLVGSWSPHSYLIGISLGLVVLFPVTARLGRTLWIYFFVKYEKENTEDQMVDKGQ